MAEIYRAQSNPGGSTALSGASPEAFGAAIGRGVEDAGGAAGRIEERRKERDRDSQTAAAGVEFAKISGELDKAEIDGRATAAPGGDEHSAAIAKFADERIGAALGSIKDPKVRQAWAARFEDLKGNAFGRAYAFESAARTDHLVTNVKETARTLALGQANNPDGMGLQISLETIDTVWNNLSVPDDVKEKGKREDQREVTLSFSAAMADKDPAMFLGDGKNGGLLKLVSPYLNAEDVDRLRARGQAELARLEAKDRQKASLWEAQRRDEIQAIGKRIGAADWSVSDADLDAAAADATKMGDKTLEVDVASWRTKRDVSLETRDYTPAQWSAAIEQLEKLEPTKRNTAQALRLKTLQELRGPAEARFAKNPQEWATNAGIPAPEIDWEQPSAAEGTARANWNRSFMRSTGSPSALLNPQEVSAFRQRAESGIAGQLETAQAMRDMFGVADAKLALQQIDKSNPNLAAMVNLPANTAKDYRIGVDAIGRNSKLNRKDLANDYFSEASPAIPEQLRGPIWDAARAIAAAELDRAGNPDPGDDDYLAAFRRGVQRATGATGTRGGLVRWIDTPIWIPPELEKGEALRRLSRASPVDLINANVGPDGTGVNGAPHYLGADGKPKPYDAAAAAQLLKRGKLESIAPGVFRIVLEDGGHVVNKRGQFWQFDIRKLK